LKPMTISEIVQLLSEMADLERWFCAVAFVSWISQRLAT